MGSAAPYSTPRPCVLVVEDDEQIAYLLQFILEREGYEVEFAPDAKAALALAARMPAPALATIDVMLPYFDGYELLARLRAQPGWDRVPVIMLSAKAQEKDIVRGLDTGANDYLVKPFMPDELRARIRRLVAA
jgi:DNA-binding response OmpR family regulator